MLNKIWIQCFWVGVTISSHISDDVSGDTQKSGISIPTESDQVYNLKTPAIIILWNIFLVLALLGDCSLCWDHWEVVPTPYTNQALP